MSALFSSPKYRPDIDGLRAIAVLSVVIFHAFPEWLKGGFIGVDIFFVISGYLISTIIFENIHQGTFRFSAFYARRIRRIFPALFLVLSTSFVLAWFVLLTDEFEQLGKHMVGGAGFIANFMLWQESGYFDNIAETKPLLHLWSLGIEEQFYLLFPPLIYLAWKRQYNLFILTLFFALLSFALNLVTIQTDKVTTFYLPHTRFWEMLSGSLLAWLHLQRNYPLKKYFQHNTIKHIFSFLGLALLIFGFYKINKNFNFPGKWALIPVLGTIFLIAAGPSAWVNQHILSRRLAIWFGLISFPLYLWHWIFLSFARIVESAVPSITIRLCCVFLSIFLAWITYRYIEQPIRHGKHLTLKTIVLSVLLALTGLLGLYTYAKNGFPDRASIQGVINNRQELTRTPARDEACLRYTNSQDPLFPYCRFKDIGAQETVAIIGDSHAHVAFPAIAEYLATLHKNTILLANSSCPPLLNTPIGATNTKDQKACKERIQALINTVTQKEEIRTVLFFSRGPSYITGTEPITGDEVFPMLPTSYMDFQQGLQATIDTLSQHGKTVFYISENPELSHDVHSCIERPYRLSPVMDCRPDKNQVLHRQKDYLNMLSNLQNVSIINGLEPFCPNDKCITHDEGKLLYADDDHLSVAGSEFLVKTLIKHLFQETE